MIKKRGPANNLMIGGTLAVLLALVTNSWGVFGIGFVLIVCGLIKEALR